MKKLYITLLSIMILVFPGVVNALGISKTEVEVEKGKTINLEISDWEEGYTAEWDSNNSGIATVERNGKSVKVTGVAKGTTAITVVVHDADGNELDADPFKCDVTVTEPEPTPTPTATPTPSPTATPTPSPSATPKEEKKEVTDFTLKKLEIEGGSIEPKFDKEITEYTLTIDDINKLDKLSITAEATDKNARVIISSYAKLSTIEKNGITITVTNDDTSKSQKYKLTLPKKEENVNLSKLELKAYPFNETFDKDVTKYTATIPYEVEEVTLDAKAEDSGAKVTHSQLNELKVGENTITVTVKNGDSEKKYTIIVTRSEEEKLEEKATSIISNKKSKTSKNSDYDIPDVDSPDSVFNLIIVTFASLMLFVAGGIGIYFFIKTSPKRLKKEVLKNRDAKKSSPLVEARPNNENIEELGDKNKDA